jgi:hypothetical protein
MAIPSLRRIELLLAAALWTCAAAAHAQSSLANLCRLLPVAQLETLFGAKAGAPVGSDLLPNIGNCSVQFGDAMHIAILSTASLVGQNGVKNEDRIKIGLKMMEQSNRPKPKAEYQFFGDVVCAVEPLDRPGLMQTICMTDRGPRQFNLLVRSDNPKQRGVEDARRLLQAVVATA